jgi:ankyrin repeat protein
MRIECIELGSILMQGGRTALAWAAYQGHTQIVHILLNAGASPDIQDQV